MHHKRDLKIILVLVLILFTAVFSPLISPTNAANCTNSPSRFGITFEKSTTSANFPGRFYIAFKNPLPENYTISGGTVLFWKTDGMYTYFRVSGISPWSYRLNWEGDCTSRGGGSW